MTRRKVKLAWVENEASRVMSLKKRRQGLIKKVRELTILCDVKACLVMFSPNEVEPTVWPSPEAARCLLHDFFALSEIERMKKETNLESYIKEKTKKVHELLKKNKKKNMEYDIDQLMAQLHLGDREMSDLNVNESYQLLSFAKDKIMHFRKKLNFMDHPPLRELPTNPLEVQFEGLRTTANDVRGGQENERYMRIVEAPRRINIGSITRVDQSYYMMDQWVVPSSEQLEPRIHQNPPNPRSYLTYQGSSSNGNPYMEMEPIGSSTFHGLFGSAAQPLYHPHNMINNPMVMSQPRQYPFGFMSRGTEVKEEGININDGAPPFHYTVASNNDLRQVPPPPPHGATTGEGNADPMSLDINQEWSGTNNYF